MLILCITADTSAIQTATANEVHTVHADDGAGRPMHRSPGGDLAPDPTNPSAAPAGCDAVVTP
jgi:hypothetical protein